MKSTSQIQAEPSITSTENPEVVMLTLLIDYLRAIADEGSCKYREAAGKWANRLDLEKTKIA